MVILDWDAFANLSAIWAEGPSRVVQGGRVHADHVLWCTSGTQLDPNRSRPCFAQMAIASATRSSNLSGSTPVSSRIRSSR